MNELDDPEVLSQYLERWLTDQPEGRHLSWVRRLPGHAGITYAFGATGGPGDEEALVLKLPPAGVSQRGSTDVLRQGAVLDAVHRLGIRAPAVRASGTEHDGPFPVPFLITTFVPGAPLGDVFADVEPPPGVDVDACFADAMDELARLHAVAWTAELGRVLGHRSLVDEVTYWTPILHKAQEPTWVRNGERLRDRLLATVPEGSPTGIVHGDFYSNNWLLADDRLAAIVDWENTVWGPRLLDLGWVCMIYDPASWGPTRQPMLTWTPEPEVLIERYAAQLPDAMDQLPWFRALAGYRLASLTAHYLKLHRTGRRHDPVWETFGEAFGPMLERGHALLDGG